MKQVTKHYPDRLNIDKLEDLAFSTAKYIHSSTFFWYLSFTFLIYIGVDTLENIIH